MRTSCANVENLTLTGSGNINGTGNSGNNILIGNSGANTLDGGTGADTMIGGLGNDTYVVNSSSDVVVENVGEGTDIVRVSVSGYTLSANVEIGAVNTTTTGLTLTGNNQGAILFGNNGDDVLIGGDSSGDLIELTGYGVATFAQLQNFMNQDGNDVMIAFDSDNKIMLTASRSVSSTRMIPS